MEKMTYVKALDAAIATLSADQSEVKEKLEALKASIAKKNSAERKPTATQTANEGYKEAILDAENGKYWVSEISQNPKVIGSTIVDEMINFMTTGKVTDAKIFIEPYIITAENAAE